MIDAASDLASLFCYFWGIIPQAKVPKSKAQTDRSFQPDCPASQRIRLLVHLGSWLGRCDCVALHRLCSMPRPLLAERRYTPITNVLLHTNNLYLPCNDQWPTVSKFCRSTKFLSFAGQLRPCLEHIPHPIIFVRNGRCRGTSIFIFVPKWP